MPPRAALTPTHPSAPRFVAPALGLLLTFTLTLALTACTVRVGGDGKTPQQHNDELRRDNQQLRKQVDETQQRIAGLQQELQTYRLQAQQDPDHPKPDMPDAVVPVLTGLEFARYTGPVDTDRDGLDDTLRLYLRPTDQKNRFRVVAGQVNVQLTRLAPEQPPQVLLERTFSPTQLDEAYRTGFTGDYYHLDLPLDPETFGQVQTITALVTLTPAGPALPVTHQANFPLTH